MERTVRGTPKNSRYGSVEREIKPGKTFFVNESEQVQKKTLKRTNVSGRCEGTVRVRPKWTTQGLDAEGRHPEGRDYVNAQAVL